MSQTFVIAFAFGKPATIRANKSLCVEIASLMSNYNIDAIYTQNDISVNEKVSGEDATIHIKTQGDTPPSTLSIARWAIANIETQISGYTNIIIVCTYPHHKRCMRDVYKSIEEYESRWLCSKLLVDCAYPSPSIHDPFNQESEQWWTRSSFMWKIRETIVMMLPWSIYKLAAS